MKKCPFCGEDIAETAIKCKHCGSMLYSAAPGAAPASAKMIQPSTPPKDPVLMAVLSGCCIAGLGQIVVGQTTKGVVCLVVAVGFGVLTAGVSAVITWPLLAIDAYLIAKKLADGRPVGEWEFF